MLVDIGTAVSILPKSSLPQQLQPISHTLMGAGGSCIACYGSQLTPLQFAVSCCTWEFTIADMNCPIFRAYFLSALGLSIDVRNWQVTSNEDQNQCLTCNVHSLTWDFNINFNDLLQDFADVCRWEEFSNLPSPDLPIITWM